MFTMINFSYLLMTILGFLGLFLIGLILLQRGRGGGLAGAFGGMGGQSAFGTKAGDVFTRITIGVASAWILLCAGSVLALHFSANTRAPSSVFAPDKSDEASTPVKKAEPKDDKPAPADDQKPEDKKADEKPAEGDKKPAEAAPAGDKPKEEAKPKEDAKPADEAKPKEDAKPTEEAKPKEGGEGDKKPEEAKSADPKPEPKDQ